LSIKPVGQLQDLVHKKGQQVEKEKSHRQVILAVAEVVLDVIALVFKGIEAFVFHFPAGAAGFDQFHHVVFAHGNIGDPTVVVGALVFNKQAVLEKVDVVGVLGAV